MADSVSCEFESSNLGSFLRRLIPLMRGFTFHEVSRVERILGRMKLDQTAQLRFPVRYSGRDVELVIRAFKNL